jgi:uncharacterized RDD family membrane protein YckC
MDNQTQFAGFWLRFLAYLIDGIIISFVEFLLVIPFLGFLGYNAAILEASQYESLEMEVFLPVLISAGTGLYLSAFLLTWFYYALMESGPRQATVGKMALGISVIDINGNRISFAKASLRYFSKIISSAIFMIGFIMAGFTEKKQALHDIIASTFVVKK